MSRPTNPVSSDPAPESSPASDPSVDASDDAEAPTVETHVAAVNAAVQALHEAYRTTVHNAVVTPLRRTLEPALDAHAGAAEALTGAPISHDDDSEPLSAEAQDVRSSPASTPDGAENVPENVPENIPENVPDAKTAWQRIRAYRQATTEHVWEPLAACLDALDVGAVLQEARSALRDDGAALTDTVPDAVTRPEPSDLYAPDASDSTPWRVRKAAVRAGRRVRGWVGAAAAPQQTVPLARLVRHHADVRLADAQAPVLDAVDQRFARWVAALERVASRWTHQLLEAERLLDAPDFHVPDEPPDRAANRAANRAVDEPADRDVDSTPDATDEPSADPTTEEAPREADDETRPPASSSAANPERLLASVREQAEALDAVLTTGAALSVGDVEGRLNAVATDAAAALRVDVQRAGTFMAASHPSPDRLPRRLRRAHELRREKATQWPDWHRQAVARLAMMQALVALRERVLHGQDALGDTVQKAGVTPLLDILDHGTERLQSVRDEVESILDPTAAGPDAPSVPVADRQRLRALERLSDDALDGLEQNLLSALEALASRRTLHATIDERIEAMTVQIDAQPRAFDVHALVAPDAEQVDPDVEAQPVQWRTLVRETLDVLLFDAWRDALAPLAERVEGAVSASTEVRTIVSFHLGAAVEELQDLVAEHRHSRAPDDVQRTDRLAAARELALGGIDRSIDALTAAASTLDDATTPFVDATWQATTQAWIRLHDRARAAGRAREHVLRLQSLLMQYVRVTGSAAGQSARRAAVQLRRALRTTRQRAERLVRLGQSAVVGAPVDESDLQETIEALSTVDATLDELPLVYRRLFSFRPVMDPDLLAGRADDLDTIQRHTDRWSRGLPNALVLTGPAGSGLTSVCNVLRKTSFRRARVHTLELVERVADEAALAERLANALGLRADPDAPWTLDALAAHLLDQPEPERLRVCIVEHLENTFLRSVDGTGRVARLLAFLSETDTRILWVVTCSDAGWQVIEKSEPTAAELVVRHALDTLDRDELETLIMTRHRRSGLRLQFEAPDSATNPILARRVQAAKDDARRQTLLRTDYFDRLYALCGQNVMLALFYWFRSVHLDAASTVLHVRPVRPIRFDAIERFSLQIAFALKALLEHATLTVDELAEVMQTSPATSQAMLETLGNALLITPVEGSGPPGSFRFTNVDRHARYRLRPLVIHPVKRFLRSRNIVH